VRKQPSSGRWRVAGRAAGLVLVSAALAACSHTPKPPATVKVTAPSTSATSTTAATTTTPTTTTPPKPKLVYAHHFTPAQQEVAQGYFAAVQAHLRASERPSALASGLAANYVGAMLTAARRDILTLASKHQAVRLPPKSTSLVRIDSVRIDGAVAIADLCTVDDAIVYERANGRIVDSDIASRRRRATLKLIAGRWKLAYRTSDAKQQGGVACGH